MIALPSQPTNASLLVPIVQSTAKPRIFFCNLWIFYAILSFKPPFFLFFLMTANIKRTRSCRAHIQLPFFLAYPSLPTRHADLKPPLELLGVGLNYGQGNERYYHLDAWTCCSQHTLHSAINKGIPKLHIPAARLAQWTQGRYVRESFYKAENGTKLKKSTRFSATKAQSTVYSDTRQ